MTPSRSTRRRALIVDDNESQLGLVRISLREVGISMRSLRIVDGEIVEAEIVVVRTEDGSSFEIEFAESGRHAAVMIFEAYRDGCPFEALILDCAMPVFDGFTVAKLVQFVESLNVIPGRARIAFLTAYDNTVQESTLLNAVPHDAYWRKDHVAESLREVIVAWLQSSPPGMEAHC